jgi:catechol 2,3-dioxygenase-like lactoylglutathione lyase family enzyme
MNRLHVHFRVKDLDASIGFYSALFGRGPDKREPDYAKWMLEDPRANIAISTRHEGTGVDHVGLQVDSDAELAVLAARLKDAKAEIVEEADATCCYARSNKFWARSPEGAKWELYHTFGDSRTFGAAPDPFSGLNSAPAAKACCG